MKKLIASLLCLAMVMSVLAGCGGADTKEETTTAEEVARDASDAAGIAAADAKAGISVCGFDDNFMTRYRTELLRYMVEKLGFAEDNINIMDAKNDQEEQMNQIDSFIESSVDVMILDLVQSSFAPQITDKCNNAGIPVVYINCQPDEAESDRWTSDGIKAAYVGADARQSGTYQGEIILETANKGDINGDGKVSCIMVQDNSENIDAQYKTEYFIKTLTDAGMEVEELLLQRDTKSQAKGQQMTKDALAQFGDAVEVVFCDNDAMALGALQAIKEAGREVNEDIYLVGADALTEAVQHTVDGTFTGTVFNDYFNQAQTAADVAVKYLNGEEVDVINMIDYVKVTADNANEILSVWRADHRLHSDR